MSPEEANDELLPVMPPLAVKILLDAWAAAVGQPALVTFTLGEITGVPARAFREWAAGHAAQFRA